ncbi:MAG: zf-HC2 domain-containing protein [Gaiellaceae bacterium]
MRCRELVELVADYLDDALPADRRAQFDSHLDGCEACSAYVDQIRQTAELVGRLPAEPLPAGMTDQLVEVFRDWQSA